MLQTKIWKSNAGGHQQGSWPGWWLLFTYPHVLISLILDIFVRCQIIKYLFTVIHSNNGRIHKIKTGMFPLPASPIPLSRGCHSDKLVCMLPNFSMCMWYSTNGNLVYTMLCNFSPNNFLYFEISPYGTSCF